MTAWIQHEPLWVLCRACKGEGEIEAVYSPYSSNPNFPCEVCDGRGGYFCSTAVAAREHRNSEALRKSLDKAVKLIEDTTMRNT